MCAMVARCIMASSLPQEFNKFCKLTEQLRQILRETQKCFHDINTLGNFEGVQIISADLSDDEEREIDNLTHKVPCLVILGQTNYAKAFIVNEIFNRTLLPPIDYGDEAVRWRMVSFRFGQRTSVSLSLPGSFELVDDLECFSKNWVTIPQKDLELPRTEEDSAKDTAVLEVKLNHPLLKHGGQVAVSPCNWGTVRQVYTQCTEDVIPVTIYAISKNVFSEKELEDLRELKEQFPEIAVFFVKVPPPVSVELDHSTNSSEFSDSGLMLSPEPNVHRHNQIQPELNNSLNGPFDMDGLGRYGVDPQSDDNYDGDINSRHKHVNSTPNPDHPPRRGSRSTWYVNHTVGQNHTHHHDHHDHHYSHHETSSNKHRSSLGSPRKRNAMYLQSSSFNLFQQLLDLGYLKLVPPASRQPDCDIYRIDSELVERFENFPSILSFTRSVLQNYLVQTTSLLNLVHTRCLQTFIMTAFDMARDMLITPKRLVFAKSKETELYNSLMDIALKKQDEIRKIIAETIEDMREPLLEKAENYDFIGDIITDAVKLDGDSGHKGVDIPDTGEVTSSKDLKICTGQIQELVLGGLNMAIAGKLIGSVDILKDSYTGVLRRCLESLEQSDRENPDATRTTLALREILNSAYQVEITVRAGSSIIRILLEKMKQLIHSMPWKTPPTISREWKRRVAADMLDSLSDSRLARSICQQIKERLRNSHDTFSFALKQLETRHTGRLEKTEEQRLKVRKIHAPKVARLALESTSLKDYILYGMPDMGREVGRGQYGVVYSCERWGSHSPCAIKSVVPPDDKHWNDLALEFYYTKNVPEHDRVVCLRGSVIDYTYGGGSSPAVLLVMDRLQKDLYTAIKTGMDWIGRLQVAIDVVEGIRFLHNQGLVHRDIKLKNVLLDKDNRGKITDLGFCKPEAMMSGSIVGTPIHMAPELFSGRYDYSVDVYAFGILFWYVCAGHVRLPYNFEQCTSKDMLWTSVRRGIRPERLPQFDPDCWDLMQGCWNGEPQSRPLLGNLEPRLKQILDRTHEVPDLPKKMASPATIIKRRGEKSQI